MFENLTAKAQNQILEALYESAHILAENSKGLLVAYEPDLKRFEHASLSVNPTHFRIDGKRIEDPDEADVIASSVDRRYVKLPDALDAFDEATQVDEEPGTGVISQQEEVLKSGQNVINGFEHIELIDVVLGGVASSNRHRRKRVPHRTMLVASKAIDLLGVNLAAIDIPPELIKAFLNGMGVEVEHDDTVQVRSFLKIAFDATYLTFPATRTFKGVRGMQGKAIKYFNTLSTTTAANDLDRNKSADAPVEANIAMPGTTVKLLDIPALSNKQKEELKVNDDDEIEVIGSINPGVLKFASNSLTYAYALRLDQSPPAVWVDGKFICLRSKEDIRRFGGRMVSIAERLEPGKRFIQDWKDELPVIRK